MQFYTLDTLNFPRNNLNSLVLNVYMLKNMNMNILKNTREERIELGWLIVISSIITKNQFTNALHTVTLCALIFLKWKIDFHIASIFFFQIVINATYNTLHIVNQRYA